MNLEIQRKERRERKARAGATVVPICDLEGSRSIRCKNRAKTGNAIHLGDRSEKLDLAEMAMAGGNPRNALVFAQNILDTDPNHLPALELCARAQWQLGDLEPLGETIHRMIRLNPYEPGYFSLLGAVEQSRGRIGSAIQAFNRCLKLSTKPDPTAVAMLQELRKYQAVLLGTLLEEDAVFRAKYRKDPVGAARARGFEIESPAIEPRTQVQPRAALLFSRPS